MISRRQFSQTALAAVLPANRGREMTPYSLWQTAPIIGEGMNQ